MKYSNKLFPETGRGLFQRHIYAAFDICRRLQSPKVHLLLRNFKENAKLCNSVTLPLDLGLGQAFLHFD